MYCSSCGIASTPGLRYCNRCGASLSITKDPKPSQSAVSSLMDSTFWVTALGLSVIVGGVAAMKKLEFREVFIVAYMVLSTVAFLGIYGMHVWQFIRLTSGGKKSSSLTEVEEPDTKELDPAQARVLPDFTPSVTEHTTRAFEPITTKRKAERRSRPARRWRFVRVRACRIT
ncbi:MAG: hypothetical protein H7Z16_01560 [Pyrinomonadaceae bacterium]|nr:hypothetical protein [Pyrinomonadaceae bacterium]